MSLLPTSQWFEEEINAAMQFIVDIYRKINLNELVVILCDILDYRAKTSLCSNPTFDKPVKVFVIWCKVKVNRLSILITE